MADRQEPFAAFFDMQGEMMREMFGRRSPDARSDGGNARWTEVAEQLRAMWSAFLDELRARGPDPTNPFDPAQWALMAETWAKAAPSDAAAARQSMRQGARLWQGMARALLDLASSESAPQAEAPRRDKRFADPAWREDPGYMLLHRAYLMLADSLVRAVDDVEDLSRESRAQLEFAAQALLEAMSPDNFLATNPVVLRRTIDSGGQNLVRGMRNLIEDLRRGQLTHSDSSAFRLGENIATTPGKVVHETPLYQLIQYSPATGEVFAVPLVIFPPWINRFYILDLSPEKSFVKWAVEQGLTVFVVSWKSADASMKDVVWSDYIRAQIDTIDHVRARLGVPAVHTIGYCVAGTTLAATLAILARRGAADKVESATFFTAQVDFEKAGDLLNFIDDREIGMIDRISPDGYLDGRYLAVMFNALRARDLIWNYVVRNYLLGEDYPAFDLLHWNGDVTNLPAGWHGAYLRDLYRDNKLAVPDALEADGTPIDLTRIETPAYIQAGREDHIAPAESVWRATRHFRGDTTFVLAGSGHIAGVINPPAANKYQHWTGDSRAASLEEFLAGATEHPGSWWPHWLAWLEARDDVKIPAAGRRRPGGPGDTVIEDAPGRYVKMR